MTDGNVSLSVSALDAYPVGSIYMSVNSTSPSTLFGGTWEEIAGGRVLIGQNTAYPAGSTGGEATHKLTTKEMPSHSHSGSTDSAGSHSHSGSTTSAGSHSHSFTTYYGAGTEINSRVSCSFVNTSKGTASTSSAGSHSHTVSIDNAGKHSHTVSINSAGGGSAHNNMQPYLSVYMWKRTA